jgi:hypothetical protein
MSDVYYTFEHHAFPEQSAFESIEKLQDCVDSWFAVRCLDDCVPKNGQLFEDEGYILTWHMDVEEPILRTLYTLHYEHYHGDYEEHNTIGR